MVDAEIDADVGLEATPKRTSTVIIDLPTGSAGTRAAAASTTTGFEDGAAQLVTRRHAAMLAAAQAATHERNDGGWATRFFTPAV